MVGSDDNVFGGGAWSLTTALGNVAASASAAVVCCCCCYTTTLLGYLMCVGRCLHSGGTYGCKVGNAEWLGEGDILSYFF